MLEEVSESKLDASKVMSAQMELLQGYQALWIHTTSGFWPLKILAQTLTPQRPALSGRSLE